MRYNEMALQTQLPHPIDFFIVGEPKSGTTALAQFLGEHPDVGIANPKEPHYFATDLHQESDAYHGPKNHHFAIRTPEQYAACFAKVQAKKILGEGSTHYLSSHQAATNIYAHNPQAKIIIMLRNPVDFLSSLHMQYVNNGGEDEADFAKALALEPARKSGRNLPQGIRCPSDLYYSQRVDYAAQIARFQAVFPPQQIKFIIMEEFNADNQAVYLDVLTYLELPKPATLPLFTTVHGSKAPRWARVHRVLNHPRLKYLVLKLVGANRYDDVKDRVAGLVLKKQPRISLSPVVRAQLQTQFKPNIKAAAKAIKRPDLLTLWGPKD